MRLRRQLNGDVITRTHHPAGDDDRHDAGLTHKLSVWIAPEHRLHQTWCKAVELGTGVTQARDLNYGAAEPKAGADGQAE